MPLCDARYDVCFNDGTGRAVSGGPGYQAVLDMAEERMPDDWGDPGPLLAARLVRWWAPRVRSIEYAPLARGKRGMGLWVDGCPRLTRASRRYLRWAMPADEPPPHDDPEWVIPP